MSVNPIPRLFGGFLRLRKRRVEVPADVGIVPGFALGFALGFAALTSPLLSLGAAPMFEDGVEALFERRCVECHNAGTTRGELNLSSPASILAGGESGPVIVPGEPDKSVLYEMVHHGEMPKKGGPLPAAEQELIREWIAGGAAFVSAPVVVEASLNQHDVLPVFLMRCAACHGRQLQEGDLDLRSVESLFRGGESGPALVAGDAEASLLIQRIESEACPPQEKLLRFFVKRPATSEVATLREWIESGAPVEEVAPDVANRDPDPLVADSDRKHWAFRPPVKSELPATGDNLEAPGETPHPVDAFVGARLREAGLDFSPEADRDTLVRRAYLDLVGMPPSETEWRYWRESEDPGWYSSMLDHLLASPRYGERWGRYWLDLAGYADSEGGLSSDPVREVAWKYRDYVVEAFNDDLPYDRFLLQQIAGDELVDFAEGTEITDEVVRHLVATGFLRMGIDQTGSRTMNFLEDRLGVVEDVLAVLGSSVLGLTMECARCHTHKYDPIPQRDYFRMKAVFQGALDEHDWLSFRNRSLEVGTPEQIARIAETNPPVERELKALERTIAEAEAELRKDLLRRHHPGISEEDQADTLVALRRASNQRSLRQAELVEQFLVADLTPDEAQPAEILEAREALETMRLEAHVVRSRLEPPLEIRALWDRGEPSPTYILRRGEHDQPGRLVGPGVPAVLTDGRSPFEPAETVGEGKTGRRLAFARWLVDEEHPLTARVMANRIWFHHFGSGLVSSMENFGVQGTPPTHPELLDWLAREFAESGWSIKAMHRLVMSSQAYRQSSRVTEEHVALDPENRLYSRMNLRRMDAEALHDSLLAVAGRLDEEAGGPPDPVTVARDGLVTVQPRPDSGDWRRAIYAQHRRTEMPTMLEVYDYPEMGPNCVERSVSIVSPQALLLLNNAWVRGLALSLAAEISGGDEGFDTFADAGASDPPAHAALSTWIPLVERAHQRILSRPPDEEELRLGQEALAALAAASGGDRAEALATYCHTLINSAAFVYID